MVDGNEILKNVQAAYESVDWHALEQDLTQVFHEIALPAIEAAGADLKMFGGFIARDMIYALRNGDNEWKGELKAQAKALLEINRIRLNEVELATFERILGIVFKVAAVAIKAAI